MRDGPRSQSDSTVVANLPLCREHFRLVLRLNDFPATAPGQFVQIACASAESPPERDLDWHEGSWPRPSGLQLTDRAAMLRRPFSLAGRRHTPDGDELDIIHRVVGTGTDWLSRLKVGNQVNVLGPLGNRFTPPSAGAEALLVGGGVGIPPMLYLAAALKGRPAVAFAGALTRDLLPFTLNPIPTSPDETTPRNYVEEFARHDIPSVVTTDDGSFGFRGFVTQALERYLDQSLARNAAARPVIYTCGPEPMMKRVAQIAADRGVECQIAVERAMACGMGTCQSCVIRVRRLSPAEAQPAWVYRLACTDGPVFAGRDLLW